ncbi:DUF882 domain-containing protein, partial [Escherichia coli]|nr:DUF882 domain-containing protein [Escherichia coli]
PLIQALVLFAVAPLLSGITRVARARSRGVAKKSYHTKGQAMDFHIEGIALSNIRKAALSMRAGGVGYYPRSNFVHIDTGPARHW